MAGKVVSMNPAHCEGRPAVRGWLLVGLVIFGARVVVGVLVSWFIIR